MRRTVLQKGIKLNLRIIGAQFEAAMNSPQLERGTILAAMFSKLAILEVSGWLEQTIDSILYYYVNVAVSNKQIRKVIKEQVIDTVYGFRYASDLKPLFMKVLGADKFLHIEQELKQKGMDQILLNSINTLNKGRNAAAHTYWHSSVQQKFDAPSTTCKLFNDIFPIVVEIDQCIRQLAKRKK